MDYVTKAARREMDRLHGQTVDLVFLCIWSIE